MARSYPAGDDPSVENSPPAEERKRRRGRPAKLPPELDALPPLLTGPQVCELFGVSRRTIRRWNEAGVLIPTVAFGPNNRKRHRYLKSDVVDLLLHERERHRAQVGAVAEGA